MTDSNQASRGVFVRVLSLFAFLHFTPNRLLLDHPSLRDRRQLFSDLLLQSIQIVHATPPDADVIAPTSTIPIA
jgi:hypothetical protein